VTPTSPVVVPSSFIKIIYKRLTPVAVHRINPLTVAPDPLCPSLVRLVRVTNKGEALAYDYP